MPGRVLLSENDEFRSIRNAVLKEAFDMHDTLKLEYEKIEKDDCDSDMKKESGYIRNSYYSRCNKII